MTFLSQGLLHFLNGGGGQVHLPTDSPVSSLRGMPRSGAAKPVDRHCEVIRQRFQHQAQCSSKLGGITRSTQPDISGRVLFPSFVCAKP
jgi:hypothetical protein